ncbi:unnamed protein product, partial [Sphacelaria rigidula]
MEHGPTPLEVLGSGEMGSYRVIQAAVPLGTRKVALQTLDDLALLFVDMRATLLVRAMVANAVMDELCLRTETFEQVSMVFGSPGELVVCAPQFLKSGGAMEHAGMLDGDLITHINGAGVALDAAEKFEWEAKAVKGVRLLDITFLRATGESSARGYPWHEALAWWQGGVRRHMLEAASPEQREWMRTENDVRGREAIWSYRLYREYSLQGHPALSAGWSSGAGSAGYPDEMAPGRHPPSTSSERGGGPRDPWNQMQSVPGHGVGSGSGSEIVPWTGSGNGSASTAGGAP